MTIRPFRPLTALALSLSLLAGTAHGALSGDAYTLQVVEQLSTTSVRYADAGFTLLDAASDRLYTADWYQHTIRLQAGQEYRIAGACDNDCRDMDLALYDADGREVARDTGQNDRPVVVVRPRRDGEYTLAVAIPDCRAGRCTYGVALYGRPRAGKPQI